MRTFFSASSSLLPTHWYTLNIEMVLNQITGRLYLAGSPIARRLAWLPYSGHLNSSGRSQSDFIATYDPHTSTLTRLSISDFSEVLPRGLSLHGMDVVPSSSNSGLLYVYLVNHRPPLEVSGKDSASGMHSAYASNN